MLYILGRNAIFATFLLTGAWIILCESFTMGTVFTGIIVSAGCICFFNKFFPAPEREEIKLIRLVVYVAYLIGQIYLSGFLAIKIILSGATVNVVKIKTKLDSIFLRTVLANSITLTPGTISLGLSGDEITVLRFLDSDSPPCVGDPGEEIKGKLEAMLIKVQK